MTKPRKKAASKDWGFRSGDAVNVLRAWSSSRLVSVTRIAAIIGVRRDEVDNALHRPGYDTTKVVTAMALYFGQRDNRWLYWQLWERT